MPNKSVKNIPRDQNCTFKSQAKAHQRSPKKEAESEDVEKLIAEAREMRKKFKGEATLEIQAWKWKAGRGVQGSGADRLH